MDNPSRTFDWTRARAVLVTAEQGSLSAAARVLGLTQPTLGRQVSAFEQELGVTVFTRAGKRMELTKAGLHLIDALRDMGRAADTVTLAAAGQSQAIAGRVAVTASDLYASHILPPVLRRLREDAPALQVQIVATNAIRDLMRREADIAIRHVRPEQPDLTARKIGEDAGTLFATPGLLAQSDDISALPFIGFDFEAGFGTMLREHDLSVEPEQFIAVTDDSNSQLALCRAGLGIAVLPVWLGDADPGLVRAIKRPEPLLRYPVWLVAHREVHNSRRVRLVFDRIAEHLAEVLRKDPRGTSAGAGPY